MKKNEIKPEWFLEMSQNLHSGLYEAKRSNWLIIIPFMLITILALYCLLLSSDTDKLLKNTRLKLEKMELDLKNLETNNNKLKKDFANCLITKGQIECNDFSKRLDTTEKELSELTIYITHLKESIPLERTFLGLSLQE